MRSFRLLSATAVAAAGFIALAGCSSSSSSSSAGTSGASGSGAGATTIRIALNNTSDSLPIVVAEKQGFFAKNHITVQPTTLADITVIPSLLGRQYDVGFTVAPIFINAVSAGKATAGAFAACGLAIGHRRRFPSTSGFTHAGS